MKNVFQELRSRDGLLLTEGKLRFQLSSSNVVRMGTLNGTVETNPPAQSTSIMYHSAQSTVLECHLSRVLCILFLYGKIRFCLETTFVYICRPSRVRVSESSGICRFVRLSSRISLLYAVISVLSVIYFFIYALETTGN